VAFPRCYLWGVLVPFIIAMDRRFAASQSLKRRLLLHLPASVLWTSVFAVLMITTLAVINGLPLSLTTIAASLRADFANRFQWNIDIYWLIVGGWLAWDYYNESRNRELKASQLETLLTQDRLQSLQTQLQPHFLFNALNTISAFVERDPRDARLSLAGVRLILTVAFSPVTKLAFITIKVSRNSLFILSLGSR
jgi:hypothetical protein